MTLPVFPALAGIGFPVKRTPIWKTLTQESASGKRIAFPQWASPRFRYSVPYEFLENDATSTDLATMLAFFNQVNGASGLFLFNDVDDNTATTQAFGAGDNVTTTFQLGRLMAPNVFVPVYAPDAGFTVTLNGVATAVTSGNLGQVTFASAPTIGQLAQWTGTFKWVCRFDNDEVDFEKFMMQWWQVSAFVFSTEKF